MPAILRSIVLKEIIKLRLLVWLPFIVLITVLLDIFMTYKSVRSIHGPAALWVDLIYKQSIHFGRLQWVFIAAGVWFAILQFWPECSGKRLRLMFHLPVSYRISLYSIAAVGILCHVLLLLVCLIGFYSVLSAFGFPAELINPMIKTLLPWWLAGAIAYFMTAAILAEPVIFRKLAFTCVGIGYISLLTVSYGFDIMGNAIWLYALLCIPWILTIEAAALRVKEGQS